MCSRTAVPTVALHAAGKTAAFDFAPDIDNVAFIKNLYANFLLWFNACLRRNFLHEAIATCTKLGKIALLGHNSKAVHHA